MKHACKPTIKLSGGRGALFESIPTNPLLDFRGTTEEQRRGERPITVPKLQQKGERMPKVRAKFRLNSYTAELHGRNAEDGSRTSVEKRTLNFTPVYSSNGNDENKRFWDATPSGSLQLGTVNPDAWSQFEVGKEYYLDFTPAE